MSLYICIFSFLSTSLSRSNRSLNYLYSCCHFYYCRVRFFRSKDNFKVKIMTFWCKKRNRKKKTSYTVLCFVWAATQTAIVFFSYFCSGKKKEIVKGNICTTLHIYIYLFYSWMLKAWIIKGMKRNTKKNHIRHFISFSLQAIHFWLFMLNETSNEQNKIK